MVHRHIGKRCRCTIDTLVHWFIDTLVRGSVEATHDDRGTSGAVSWVAGIALRLSGLDIQLVSRDKVKVNGTLVQLPYLQRPLVFVERSESTLLVSTNLGVKVSCVFIFCVHILYSYSVFMFCIYILCSCFVFIFCVHILYSYSMSMVCIHILYSYSVFIFYIHILC